MAADDLESLHETLYWLSRPGIRDSLAESDREYGVGETTSGEDLRAEFGLPPR
jgi:antitoxin YefM